MKIESDEVRFLRNKKRMSTNYELPEVGSPLDTLANEILNCCAECGNEKIAVLTDWDLIVVQDLIRDNFELILSDAALKNGMTLRGDHVTIPMERKDAWMTLTRSLEVVVAAQQEADRRGLCMCDQPDCTKRQPTPPEDQTSVYVN